MKNVLEVKNLSKTFETQSKGKEKEIFTAVDNISFEVEKGEIIGFIGPNGAGKSTTIKMLTGILFPSFGEILVCGFSPWQQRKEMAYHIATMFGQKSCLLSHLPVIESYKLNGAIYDIPQSTLNERISEISEFFGIEHLLHQKASSLSLGQRMICEVAAVTLHRPDVIFFDEPTIGLDIVVKKKVRDMILTMNKKFGTTIFITSHDLSDIEKLCSRIILINHGHIMLDSPLEEIKHSLLSKRKVSVIFYETLSHDVVCSAFKNTSTQIEISDRVNIEFDEKLLSTGKVLQILTSLGTIQDLSIANASLENVIYDIYTNKEEPT